MNSFLIYIIKASAGIIVLSLPYYFFLRKDPNLNLKRFFLLGGLILAFVLPLIPIRIASPVIPENPVFFIQLEQADALPQTGSLPVSAGEKKPLSLLQLILLVYLAGIAVLTIRNLLSFRRWKLFRRSNPLSEGNLLYTDRNEVFTLFRTIHLPRSVVGSEEHQSMLIHERAHVRQLHFIDLLLCETALFVTWFNPFTWLITRMIKENHEHLADREVLLNGVDPVRYRAHLLNSTLGVPVFRFGLAFSYSLTKKRFDMMKNLKSGRAGLVKVFLLVPLVLFAMGCMNLNGAKGGKVKGVVILSDTGKPATGTSIIIQGTSVGTVADEDGKFELKLSDPTDIVFSFVGYNTCVHNFKPGEEVKVELTPQVFNLNLPSVDPDNGKIRLKSDDGFKPLVLVDGEERDDYESIDPEMIASVSVIKDKSILEQQYPGKDTRGGVVLITLKKEGEQNEKAEQSSGDEEVFIVVEDVPQFEGGMEELSRFIYANLKYPEEAKAKGLEGSASVLFTIDTKGRVSDVKIASSTDPVFDEAARAVISSVPDWKPGMQRGKAVAVRFSVRVDFKLPGNHPE